MVGKRRLRISSLGDGNSLWTKPREPGPCPLCERPMVDGPTVDEHHLVPKSKGGKSKHLLHKVCHQKIHSVLTETALARDYHSWEALKTHPEIQKFIDWIQKKPPDYIDLNRTSKTKRQGG